MGGLARRLVRQRRRPCRAGRDAAGRGWDQTAGEAWIRAALSYHFGKFVWMLDMARHDQAAGRAVAAMASAHRLLDPTAERAALAADLAAAGLPAGSRR